jgi:hypothetical protein
VEGVRQESFEELERTLLALGEEYRAAKAEGDRKRAARCRRAVITGKDHARLSAGRSDDPARSAEKQEMITWMLVWLETPEAFPVWLRLRKAARSSTSGPRAGA